ncbi:MAG: hypothetical protein A2754_00330 [Candidatus Magasanikbacteria bacterium RIFCSPHIGHO2_01_FULL_47_8]|uniref:Uncharacterized protein n=1 Tax=Candidatus Magasanikbacteria bacterium RIFCSPHIGHO2_01_FULL_47_8 TaxID=1798673 RepID=A0A1F6MDF8_9BACT|nr:MAG: hypothetical protein A2754_00330 [Candidatus Magasanikbacteria bacterium RIFCSPHIGHO2_01_FULL_47_8]
MQEAVMAQAIHGYTKLAVKDKTTSLFTSMLLLVYTDEEGKPTEILVVFSLEQLFHICATETFRTKIVDAFVPGEPVHEDPEVVMNRIAAEDALPPQSHEEMQRVTGPFVGGIVSMLYKFFQASPGTGGFKC